jgi:hypothetical protein
MRIPKQINKGDSLAWKDDSTIDELGNTVDSSSWTLAYIFAGATSLTLNSSSDESGWQTSITATDSGTLTPGVYYWQAIATNGSQKKTLGRGRIEVLPSLVGAANGFDGRSQNRKDLDSVQAAIRAIVSGGTQEYTIGNRSFRKIDLPALMERESKLKFDVAQEEKSESIKNGLGNPHRLGVRF